MGQVPKLPLMRSADLQKDEWLAFLVAALLCKFLQRGDIYVHVVPVHKIKRAPEHNRTVAASFSVTLVHLGLVLILKRASHQKLSELAPSSVTMCSLPPLLSERCLANVGQHIQQLQTRTNLHRFVEIDCLGVARHD